MSNSPYDSTSDVRAHQEDVRRALLAFALALEARAEQHDRSKLSPEEKPGFDHWRPVLRQYAIGSPEYNDALRAMSDTLEVHYRHNRHHPEHFANGVAGMTLVDVVEMFCDWYVSARSSGTPINYAYLASRFDLTPQLVAILENTEKAIRK